MGRKLGALCPFGGAESPCNTMAPHPRSTSVPSGILIHRAVWPQQTWAEIWERGCLCPFGGAESPSNTTWPGPTSMQSSILIHLTTIHQRCNVGVLWSVNRTERQTGQRSDSVERTVLQTVAKNHAPRLQQAAEDHDPLRKPH